ncbi:MAG: ribosomal protein S18-alanine N-acetyltransferase [Proteobacteria bacterium]|nr:ribosomal protein S18-alanine N-acetyltransferase [Pseudomonadota bacterium]
MNKPMESFSAPKKTGPQTSTHAIRAATLNDLDAILAIERSSFAFPWPNSAFTEEIEGRSWSKVVAADCDDKLVGFMIYWIVANEFHLLNLAVDPAWRRRRIAYGLVQSLIGSAKAEKRARVLLEVRVSNQAALELYKHFRFEPLAVRPGYYSNNGEDALVMSLQLDNPEHRTLQQ